MLPTTKPDNLSVSESPAALTRRDATTGGLMTLLLALLAGWAPRTVEAAPVPDDELGPPFAPIELRLLGMGWVRDGVSKGRREAAYFYADIRFDETGAWTMAPAPDPNDDEPGPVYSGGPTDSARTLAQLLADFSREYTSERHYFPD